MSLTTLSIQYFKISIAVIGIHDDYWINNPEFCIDKSCSAGGDCDNGSF